MIAVYEARKGDIEKSIESQEASVVENTIFLLPVEERIIFILHDIDKLPVDEITLITKDSVEHIKIELERARKFMMDKLRVKRLDDLDYKITFLPQKIEPAPEFWNIIFNTINKTEPEEPKVQEGIGKKLMGLFKKKN